MSLLSLDFLDRRLFFDEETLLFISPFALELAEMVKSELSLLLYIRAA